LRWTYQRSEPIVLVGHCLFVFNRLRWIRWLIAMLVTSMTSSQGHSDRKWRMYDLPRELSERGLSLSPKMRAPQMQHRHTKRKKSLGIWKMVKTSPLRSTPNSKYDTPWIDFATENLNTWYKQGHHLINLLLALNQSFHFVTRISPSAQYSQTD
jgi:hypothetical protein